jgi:N6-L-threonylcarbamoyladenine synthase
MLVLGIESSCDETAAAVVSSDGEVRASVIHSQVALHATYGGVVPELASRDHMTNVRPVVERALEQAGVGLSDIALVGATCRPGLVGALLVGVQVAKGLAWSTGKPFIGADHLVGHILAPFLRDTQTPESGARVAGEGAAVPAFPFLALLVSGGHTALYRVDGPRAQMMRELGATRDDAAGETFDKVGKLLGLGYPGGPVIDRLAHEALASEAAGAGLSPDVAALLPTFKAPRVGDLEFSFSGLKSQVARYVEQAGVPADPRFLAAVCARFQRTVVRTLVTKLVAAAKHEGVPRVVVTGGVSANRGLKTEIAAAARAHGLIAYVPQLSFCTDNAAMIAFAAAKRFEAGERDDFSVAVTSVTSLPRVTRKGRGPR